MRIASKRALDEMDALLVPIARWEKSPSNCALPRCIVRAGRTTAFGHGGVSALQGDGAIPIRVSVGKCSVIDENQLLLFRRAHLPKVL